MDKITVYCSAPSYEKKQTAYGIASLRYSRLKANGPQSIIYDFVTCIDAVRRGHDHILLLGVSGAIVLPILRLFSSTRLIVNVDGQEWNREKWQGLAKHFLRWSERLAVRFAHQVIADNQGISDYLKAQYGVNAPVIAYGGDHALVHVSEVKLLPYDLPPDYALALSRIEPENNVEMILEAFKASGHPLVFVGNWQASDFGQRLKESYGNVENIRILDPIYDQDQLFALRRRAVRYIHGHSAGGTNPALVEMMHFSIPVFAFDCNFNRYTTEEKATYFQSAPDLSEKLMAQAPEEMGEVMLEIARRRYSWDQIGKDYFDLLQTES